MKWVSDRFRLSHPKRQVKGTCERSLLENAYGEACVGEACWRIHILLFWLTLIKKLSLFFYIIS